MKRKKLFVLFIMIMLAFAHVSNSNFVFAKENDFHHSYTTPYEIDRMLHRNIIDTEIVIYDDANDVYVPSHYDSVSKTIIPNAVDPTDLRGGSPYWYRYFSRILWLNRSGAWSLALTPKGGSIGAELDVWYFIYNQFFTLSTMGMPITLRKILVCIINMYAAIILIGLL